MEGKQIVRNKRQQHVSSPLDSDISKFDLMARDITFLTVFLESCGAVNNDEAGKLLSAWTSTVRIEGPEPTDSNSLYIPLLPPGMLKVCFS